MNTHRKTAIIVGTLFIIGTVAGILSVVVTTPVLDGSDYLVKVSTDGNRLIIGALLILTMGLVLALVPVVLFPIARKHNEPLALGYVVFRGALEPIATISAVIPWLALIVVGQEYVKAGAPDASYFQTLGAMLLGVRDALGSIVIIIFSLDALMLYALLYQSRLVPRWLSVWGFIAISLHLATAFLALFALADGMSPIALVMHFPIFLQEMVMAVWLIVKGFNVSTSAPKSVSRGYELRLQEHA
jgi:hypothetical protein